MDKIESHGPHHAGVLAEFCLSIQSLADDFRRLARNRSEDERERIFAWHFAGPYAQLYLAGGKRYVQEEAYPHMRRLSGWDDMRWSRHIEHIRDLAAYAWMRDAALDLPFVLERWVTRPEFVEDLEFQFLELLERLEPPALPALELVQSETLPLPESIPSEPAPSNADQGPVSHEMPPGPVSEGSLGQPSSPGSAEPDLSTPHARPQVAETLPLPESKPSEPAPSNSDQGLVSHEMPPGPPPEGQLVQPLGASSPGSVEPDLSTPAARRRFLDVFTAECKRLAERNVYIGDLALIAGHRTPNRRFAVYEWLRRGRKGHVYQMLMAGPAKAVESLKSPKNERIRAMTRSTKAARKV